jgi:hypothetical protein
MPNLAESLQGRDLGHLRIVAEFWGLEFSAPDARVGLQRLAPLLIDSALVIQVVDDLPPPARQALGDLLQNEGRLSWALFTRRHGIIREMGAGRRDREKPYLYSASPAECLWYRGLVARGFFDVPTGPEEFAYIPDDLSSLLPEIEVGVTVLLGRPASPAEKAIILPANEIIVDHACSLLAAIRMGTDQNDLVNLWHGWPDLPILAAILKTAGLLDAAGFPVVEPVRLFLEGNRGQALAVLAEARLHSREFNELHMLPGLHAEGEWQNNPYQTRERIINFLPCIQGGKLVEGNKEKASFWSISALVNDVRLAAPDFQRPMGDYTSWYLRDLESDSFLMGFENWDRVDGALIRWIITGPLHWLGFVDLAAPEKETLPSAFRYSPWANNLLQGVSPEGLPEENQPVIARSDAKIWVPRLAPRSVRYQVARFCVWDEEKEDGYTYIITPGSLVRAREGGLRVNQLLVLLRKYSETVPPTLSRALERWDERGVEARFQQAIILRLGSPEHLQQLRNSRAARFLGDPLGPTTVIVKGDAWQKVKAVLAELGYLSEVEIEDEN